MIDWLTYFERNRRCRLAIPWEQGITVEARLRGPLIRSLQRFQVGERGDGWHLRRGAAATGDPTYAAAVALFIAEEQEHARLLARLLQVLGGTVLERHWSERCFVRLRRLAGLRLELLVLLTAELIGERYYRALYERTDDPVLRAALAQILCDEAGHLTFHCEYLAGAIGGLAPLSRRLIRLGWHLLFRAACLVVIYDHRAAFAGLGVSPDAFWATCERAFEAASARILTPAAPEERQVADHFDSRIGGAEVSAASCRSPRWEPPPWDAWASSAQREASTAAWR